MFIYLINDSDKKFKFDGKNYKTPCLVPVYNSKQIDKLNEILKQINITKVSVQNSLKSKSSKTLQTIPTSGVPTRLVLKTNVLQI